MSKKTDLTTLIPDQTFNTSVGEIVIRPFLFNDTNRAIDIISKYTTIFFTPKKESYLDEEGVEQTAFVAKETGDIVQEILQKGEDNNYSVLEDVSNLLELSSKDISRVIGKLTYPEVIYLLSVIVKLNQDFFTQIKGLFPAKEKQTEGLSTLEKQSAV